MTPLQLLEQTELEAVLCDSFYRSNDRIFSLIGAARRKLRPPRGDMPKARVKEGVAVKIAAREIAKTILQRDMDEPSACCYLAHIGATVRRGRTRWIINRTVLRLRADAGNSPSSAP